MCVSWCAGRMCVLVCRLHVPGLCVCVLMCRVDSSMYRFIDAFVDPSIPMTHPLIRRFIDALKTRDVVVLLSSSVFFSLLCSDFVNFGVDLGVILSISELIFMSFVCPWKSFGDPVPSRGPPKGAKAKMWTKKWFVGPPLDPQRAPQIY